MRCLHPLTNADFAGGVRLLDAALHPMASGRSYAIEVEIENRSRRMWVAEGATPVRFAYHWLSPSRETVVHDGLRTALPADLAAGAKIRLGATIESPKAQGVFLLQVTLVEESVAWFEALGFHSDTRRVEVVDARDFARGKLALLASPERLIAGHAVRIPVTLTNESSHIWPRAEPCPVAVSYHWRDPAGLVTVHDGLRTLLGADLAPGGSRTLLAEFWRRAGRARTRLKSRWCASGCCGSIRWIVLNTRR